MSTKPAADGTAHLAFILSAIQNIETEVKIDWNKVAQENGIGYARNASTKFKDTLKKYGYKYEGNQISKLDDEENGDAGVPATPKAKGSRAGNSSAKKTGGSSTTKASVKKRKIAAVGPEVDSGDDDGKTEDRSGADDHDLEPENMKNEI